MPLVGIVLVLAAAVVHAAWNLTLHATEDRPATMAVAGLLAGLFLLPGIVLAPPWPVLPLVVLSALAETAYALFLSSEITYDMAVPGMISSSSLSLVDLRNGQMVWSNRIGDCDWRDDRSAQTAMQNLLAGSPL